MSGSKRNVMLQAIAAFLSFILLLNCSEVFAEDEKDSNKHLKIAVASDLHVDPLNKKEGIINPLTKYNSEIIDALLWDAFNMKVDVLVLCGDLSNAAHINQHSELTEKLQIYADKGLKTILIPGNHDIGEVDFKGFEIIYGDFGFNDALSRDPESLSYSIIIGGYLFLMMDTGGYYDIHNGPYISSATLKWANEQINTANEMELEVFPVGHYPLLTSSGIEGSGLDEFRDMLTAANIQLYVCGHLHQRHVSVLNSNSCLLAELVVDQTTAYPCSYAIICTSGNKYNYEPRKLDIQKWAELHAVSDEQLLNFDSYQTALFMTRAMATVDALDPNHTLSADEDKDAREFIWLMEDAYWDGSLSYKVNELMEHPGYKSFMSVAEGSVYARWLPSAMQTALPYTAGFVIKDSEIFTLDEYKAG